ncbi:hypothetical protein V536_02157, partial [Staphylococcus aureus F87602]
VTAYQLKQEVIYGVDILKKYVSFM